MFVYARYRRITALVAPSANRDKPLSEDQARGLSIMLRQRYPLAGMKFWSQVEPNPKASGVWAELRDIAYKALEHPAAETPLREPAWLPERQASAYLDLPLDRLRQEVNAGRLAFTGTKRNRRFTLSELDRWRTLQGLVPEPLSHEGPTAPAVSIVSDGDD